MQDISASVMALSMKYRIYRFYAINYPSIFRRNDRRPKKAGEAVSS